MASRCLSESTVGRRQLNQKDAIEKATNKVLERLVKNSRFFDENPPMPLPTFTAEEIELQPSVLGRGEFGVVSAVAAVHVPEECPCQACDLKRSSSNTQTSAASRQPHLIIDGVPSERYPLLLPENENALLEETNTVGAIGAHYRLQLFDDNNVNNTSNRVTFAEDVKLPDDDRTLVTNQEDDNYLDDCAISVLSCDDEDDGEVEFLRGYMSTHCLRRGLPRYAVKRLRRDLSPNMQLNSVIDIACESKFMSVLRHPNIVRMRATVGTPGSIDFMIVMDCLQKTLREQIDEWKIAAPKHSRCQKALSYLFPLKRPKVVELDEKYSNRLLAVYDIARAMRHLHNHNILFRDLKPENVAFDLRGDMRLFDFGLAKELKAKDLVEAPDGFNATGLTGSRRYMAPEVVLCKNYGFSADVYSFGILFWEVFANDLAFPKMSFDKHFERVVLGGKRPPQLSCLPKQLDRMMKESWSEDRMARPSFKSICEQLGAQVVVVHSNASAKGITDRSQYLMERSLRSRLES